jgi:hypothetical protein
MLATPWEKEATTASYHDALAALGLATLPGLLVTDFYDLALAQNLPRAQSVAISDATGDSWAGALMGMSAIAPMFFGLIILMAAAWRAGVVRGWYLPAIAVAWLLPFVSGTGLVPAALGAGILVALFGSIGLKVARMSDQAWAERPARSRTIRAKAPKIAVESAA